MEITKEFKKQVIGCSGIGVRFNYNGSTQVELYDDNNDCRTIYPFKDITIEKKKAFFSLSSYVWDGVVNGNLGAFLSIVKTGDRIIWGYRTNNSQLLSDAGLYNDELTVTIYRKNRKGDEKKIISDMVLDNIVCADNSARCIKGLK